MKTREWAYIHEAGNPRLRELLSTSVWKRVKKHSSLAAKAHWAGFEMKHSPEWETELETFLGAGVGKKQLQ